MHAVEGLTIAQALKSDDGWGVEGRRKDGQRRDGPGACIPIVSRAID